MFWKYNTLFEPEFLEKYEKMEFQDHYQPRRYKEAEDDILCNITNHKPYLDIDYEELLFCPF